MDLEIMKSLAVAGSYLGVTLGAIGSAVGTGVAGMAAIGAWKKRYAQNKPAQFLLMVMAGAPLSQTIYAFVLMDKIVKAEITTVGDALSAAFVGVFAGVAFLASAWYQGKAGAVAADAYGETDKGFANYLTVLGIVETVALFALVFGMGLIK